MEELSETAKAYYANLSQKQKRMAVNLFKEIDTNGDGTITFDEYTQYTEQKRGFKTISSPEFFKKLEKDGNDTLDFDEFVTLHYICARERVMYCDECKEFLDRVYFTCVQCFNGSGNTYDLCCACYRDKTINHQKDAVFIDNCTLLQAKRNQKKGSKDQVRGALEMVALAGIGIEATADVFELCSQM